MAVCKSILSLKVHSPRMKICLVSEEHFNGMFKSTLSAGFSFSSSFFCLRCFGTLPAHLRIPFVRLVEFV